MAQVDIIISAFNRTTELQKALKSVQEQSFDDFKCYVCEDGQTDKIYDSVKHFLKDGRFEYISGQHAGFPASPRNRGIKKGESKYIAFLDDNDLWLKNKLEEQIDILEKNESISLIGTNAYRQTESSQKISSMSLCLSHLKKSTYVKKKHIIEF